MSLCSTVSQWSICVPTDTNGVAFPLPPYPAPRDAPGAAAGEAALHLGASVAGGGEGGGAAPEADSAEGPIGIDSYVDIGTDA